MSPPTQVDPRRAWVRRALVAGFGLLLAVELVLGWPSLADAFSHLRSPHPGWLAAAVAAELAAMGMYARMQRRLLSSGGVRVPLVRVLGLTYAAHSLSATLPGGAAFSTQFNYRQMRRFGASPAVASWSIALSGILSATALAVITAAGALRSGGAPAWQSLAGLGVAALLVVVGLPRLTRRPEAVRPLTRAALTGVNRLRGRPSTQGVERADGFIEQLGAARLGPADGAAASAFALLNWLLDAVCLWLSVYAIAGPGVGWSHVLLAFCAGMAAGTVNLVPGGLGVIDSALVLGLLAGGLDTPTAIASVVLYRLVSFGLVIGIGWLAWIAMRRSDDRRAKVDGWTT